MADEQEPETERERRDAQRRVLRITLGELEEYVDQAAAGGLVVVPDGLPEVIRRLRSDLTQALGPQEAGDLVPIFRGIDERLAAIEAVQRWTVAYWLSALAQRIRSWWRK